jgi:hypothetical protein
MRGFRARWRALAVFRCSGEKASEPPKGPLDGKHCELQSLEGISLPCEPLWML